MRLPCGIFHDLLRRHVRLEAKLVTAIPRRSSAELAEGAVARLPDVEEDATASLPSHVLYHASQDVDLEGMRMRRALL